MLQAAGVVFAIEASAVDEAPLKRQFQATGKTAMACAQALALAKASGVASWHPESVVVGADQILVADGEWFDKPASLADAAAQLCRLRGRKHVLATAACAVRANRRVWQATATPALTMRPFSDGFIAGYIESEGERVLGSVGAYRLEGNGVQLFERIDGDYFAILGLPLLPLLEFLRRRGLLGE